jgi:hypothetical protein
MLASYNWLDSKSPIILMPNQSLSLTSQLIPENPTPISKSALEINANRLSTLACHRRGRRQPQVCS